MKIKLHRSLEALTVLVLSTINLQPTVARAQSTAQGTPFLYKGHLDIGGCPASGNYDLTFFLFESSQGGMAKGGPITNSAIKVRNGLFAVTLDFGSGPFSGTNYWLDIAACTNGSGAFTELSRRQRLTPSPYAHGPQRVVNSVFKPQMPKQASKLPRFDCQQNSSSGVIKQ